MIEDKVLITQVITFNSQRAFAELVSRYQSKLIYSIMQMNGWDIKSAEDLSQEVFTKAYFSLKNFNHQASFFTWLYRIAHNKLIDHSRKHAQHEWVSLEANVEEVERVSPVLKTLEITQDIHQQVSKCLLQFNPLQRSVLHLHLHRDLNHGEIADLLSIPLGTVKSWISRGKIVMREQLRSVYSVSKGT